MKELSTEDLKNVQLQIMDYVDSFCRNNNIQYTIAFGTLLGAVRHGGFIPWDDDIDIQLLRPEYERFIALWDEKKNGHPYELISIESGNNMGYPFGKVHDPNTVTYVGNIKRTGVFIDIFPVDYVVDRDDYLRRSKKIEKLIKKRYACFTWMTVKNSRLPLSKKIVPFLRKPIMSYERLAVAISDLAKKVNVRSEYACDMINGRYSKEMMMATVYKEFMDIKFEDRIYRSVKDMDTYLTNTYGDWRTPPPPEKQITHHGFKAFWL